MIDIPEGWQLVPKEPTPDMLNACRGALYRYIVSLPEDERKKFADRKNKGGYRVAQKLKVVLRWRAMLEAAPVALNIHKQTGERS